MPVIRAPDPFGRTDFEMFRLLIDLAAENHFRGQRPLSGSVLIGTFFLHETLLQPILFRHDSNYLKTERRNPYLK